MMNNAPPRQEKPPVIKSAKTRLWLRRFLEALLFIAIIFGVRAWQQRDVVQGAAPALNGIMLDGRPFALAAAPAQPVLVHFWATWCPICRAEEGSIDSLARDNPNVITIAMQSGSSSAVRQYLREQALSFPVINDTDGRISASWGVQAVPASFVIGTDGKIRFVEIGYTTGVGLRLRLWLAGF